MGFPMAGWLSRSGCSVKVFNRTREKAELWCRDYQGEMAATAVEAAAGAEAVFTCLGDDPDLREVVLATDGVLQAMKSGALFIDHTPASAGLAREIAVAGQAHGVQCLDAPVSGGQAGAQSGELASGWRRQVTSASAPSANA